MRFLLALAVLLAVAPGTRAETAALDTTVTRLEDLVVGGAEAATTRPDRTRLEAPVIAVQDPASLADLGGLLPSARVSSNSRGDATLMIRGAPERHVQTFLDAIPLNLPWDERADLRTIPITGTASLAGTRGLTTLLDGPGVLAGSLRILPPGGVAAPATRLAVGFGHEGLGRADFGYRRPFGGWDLTAAGGWLAQDGFPVPGSSGARFNSDLEMGSFLLRGSRPAGRGGRLSLLASGWTAALGVPPETHLGDEARFWRYPSRRRALLGASVDLPFGADADWDLRAVLSADYFDQEIDARGPDGWDAPPAPGDEYEWDRDRTAYGNVRLSRWLGHGTRLALQATGRYAHHTETLEIGGPRLAYAQWLTALAAETDVHAGPDWTLRAGVGWDHAATPEAGDKSRQDPRSAPAWNLRLTRELNPGSRVFAAASRRSRFPSLRELYSGALGRFVPDPGLRPERQVLYEVGAAFAPGPFELEAGLFVSRLEDGIEKVALNDEANRFVRTNRTAIRVPGVEVVARWRPAGDLRVDLHHTVMRARVSNDGRYDRPAEDRPDYLARALVDWRPVEGPGALVEADATGPRWSADASGASAGAGGLARLSAGVVWNVRLSWRLLHPQTTVDLFLRADNVFDQPVPWQLGLVNPGRWISFGAVIGS